MMATTQRSWWSRLVGWMATPPPIRAQATGVAYEGASTGRRARGWHAPTSGPNAGVLGSLSLLRDRSRQAVRNDGYARSAIGKLVSNIIGTGIKPLSQAPDPEFRQQVHALWLRWTDESDADGRLDFYGQQALAVRGWLEAGELFARLRLRQPADGLSVPLQIQLLEPELCPVNYSISRNGSRVRAGIEFNGIGARVAYWMYRSRPGDPHDMDTSHLVPVPAESVLHLYDPVRPGQIRGLPHLTPSLVQLWDIDKYDDATLVRQQISNLFVGFISQESGGQTDVNPLTGETIETDGGRGLTGLEPGLLQELRPGQDIRFPDVPAPANTYPDFMRQQILRICAAVDVPYEILTGDLSKVNDRTVRVVLNEFRRSIEQRQHGIVVYQLCRPIWTTWFNQAVLSGALQIPGGVAAYMENPEPFRRVKWMPQGWRYIHPVQDVDAAVKAIRSGLNSRTSVVSELGEDVEVIDQEIADDNRRADALGLRLDSDSRQTDATGKTVSDPAPPGEDVDEMMMARASRFGGNPAPQTVITVNEGAVHVEGETALQVTTPPGPPGAKGDKGDPGKGEKGDKGDRGEEGKAAPRVVSKRILLGPDEHPAGVEELYDDGQRIVYHMWRERGRIHGLTQKLPPEES